ncbi:MAG: hypothetical protein EOP93_25340 [Lysobacteraceae bacterium]|nr:MAG: hypothetical protein EOP93_25340 [Xanthomonadaceae bacterium]
MTRLHESPIRVLLTALCGAWLGAAALPALAADCPVPSAPAGARVEMIAPQVEANGLDTSIRAVTVAMPVAGVLGHYRTLWAPLATPSRPGSLENEAAGWKIISSIDGRCLTTVQVKPQGLGSYALVSVARIQDTADRVATETSA